MTAAREFLRGVGATVDLSGRGLQPRHLSLWSLWDELFESVNGHDSAEPGGASARSDSEPVLTNRLMASSELYQRAISEISTMQQSVQAQLEGVPEEARARLADQLEPVLHRYIQSVWILLEEHERRLVRPSTPPRSKQRVNLSTTGTKFRPSEAPVQGARHE